MKRLAALIPLLICTAPGAHAAANLLANGSFETGDFSGWTVGGVGISDVIPGGIIPGYDTAEDGSLFLYTVFEQPGQSQTFSQTFADTPGQVYNVTFWLFDGAFESTDTFSASLDGTTALSIAPGAFDWTRHGFTFTGTGSDTVEFALGSFDIGWAFDNASVTAAPEPAAWAMMLVGFAGLGATLRSRRKLQVA